MISNFFKIIFTLLIFFLSTEVNSKTIKNSSFNASELSNFFSGVIADKNQENKRALKFLKSAKGVSNKYDQYSKKYVISLVLNQNLDRAIQEVKFLRDKKKNDFFEAQLLLLLDSIKKQNFKKTDLYLKKISKFKDYGMFEQVIYESLRDYIYVFKNKNYSEYKSNFGNLSLINKAFFSCYLDDKNTIAYFENLNNSQSADYSRYIFFYTGYLLKKNKTSMAKNLLSQKDDLNSSLIVLQSKSWIDQKKIQNFEEFFSCKNELDLLAEFFFLISNLYSSEGYFKKSNFYLNISHYLNDKFKFNLTLMAENFYSIGNFKETKNILSNFSEQDELYYWYKIKKISNIISKEDSDDLALDYIEKKFKKIKNPQLKIVYDTANIYKNFKKYEKAIELYSKLMENINKKSDTFADLLYKRGGCYERLGYYKKADKDLLDALNIIPDNSYVLNYLAYSWLERGYNINNAILMLEKAYSQNENDPYIIDSVGWGYYLIGKFDDAEKLMKRALEQMPNDPIVNDHYGDILWSLNKKIQALYFWKNALKSEEADKEMKKKIKAKLLLGLEKKNESL